MAQIFPVAGTPECQAFRWARSRSRLPQTAVTEVGSAMPAAAAVRDGFLGLYRSGDHVTRGIVSKAVDAELSPAQSVLLNV